MTTYKTTHRSADHASQSRVVRSSAYRATAIRRWSVHLMRSRNRYTGAERRGWTLFLHLGSMRAEVGKR